MDSRVSALENQTIDLSGYASTTTTEELDSRLDALEAIDHSQFATTTITDALDGRLDTLEAIDHSQFATKSEVQSLDDSVSEITSNNGPDYSGVFRCLQRTGSIVAGADPTTYSVSVEGFDMENCVRANQMFASGYISSISGWEGTLSKLTHAVSMFASNNYLTSLSMASQWTLTSLINAHNMFSACSGLTTLDGSTWGLDKVRNAAGMFYRCSGLTTITGMGNWNLKPENISQMFYNCSALTTIDMTNWDTTRLSTSDSSVYTDFITGCDALTTIIGYGSVLYRFQSYGIISTSRTLYSSTLYTLTGTCSDGVFTESS